MTKIEYIFPLTPVNIPGERRGKSKHIETLMERDYGDWTPKAESLIKVLSVRFPAKLQLYNTETKNNIVPASA